MQLGQDEFAALLTNFFPTIKATLNHILTVDWFYIDALEREAASDPPHPDYLSFFRPEAPFATAPELQRAQAISDRRLIAYCHQLDGPSLDRQVTIQREHAVQRDTRARLLAHLFQHQVHHRGQVHAMLSGSSVPPPQLDEFFLDFDRDRRADEVERLGLAGS